MPPVYAFEQLTPTFQSACQPIADVLSAAWAEAQQIRAQARIAGEEEGRAAGLAAAREEISVALAALACAVEEVQRLRGELVVALELDAVEVALRLTEQILSGVLAVQPEQRVVDIARNALRHLADRRSVTIVVNPADLELINGAVERLGSELGGIEHCNVQADRRVGPGGAIARTESGEIDSTIEAQLARAREIVVAVLSDDDLTTVRSEEERDA